jgi:hypothetical protein
LDVSQFFLHSQTNGKTMDISKTTLIMAMFVLPNCEIPKKVATVLGKEVIVVTMVK